jgi:hypothetical protein
MPSRNRARNGIPVPVLRAALEKGIGIQSASESIIAVGLGFKYRRRGGYGQIPTPCVTFTVPRKHPTPKSTERVPHVITVNHRGKRWRVKTDVRSRGRATPHGLVRCSLIDPKDSYFGSVGFVVRSDNGKAWLVTAGHVLIRPTGSPFDEDVVGAGDQSPLRNVGRVIAALTHFPADGSGTVIFDVGVVPLDPGDPGNLKTLLNRQPWNQVETIAPLSELLRVHSEPKKPYYRLFGARSEMVFARYAASNFTPITFDVEEKGIATTRTYAAITILSEVTSGTGFQGGDSGGPLVDDEGRLWGIHILGIGSGTQTRKGLAIFADSILGILRKRLRDDTIALIRPNDL